MEIVNSQWESLILSSNANLERTLIWNRLFALFCPHLYGTINTNQLNVIMNVNDECAKTWTMKISRCFDENIKIQRKIGLNNQRYRRLPFVMTHNLWQTTVEQIQLKTNFPFLLYSSYGFQIEYMLEQLFLQIFSVFPALISIFVKELLFFRIDFAL